MERAVIAIGVGKTGQLPELQAAVQSATNVAAWARGTQKVPAKRVKLITDAKGAVSRDRIFEAVHGIVKLGFIEQLIVYFSGHGINSGMFEQWLLSRAPDDTAAAINVKGSEFAARFCGVGHVVFISDACRTAADSIQAQRVTGGDLFPNVQPSGPENPVDQFYATLVGNPAFEVKSVQDSTGSFRAAYSTVLMRALGGQVAELIEKSASTGVIRPRPLKKHLAIAVPRFFIDEGLGGAVSSQPDARIESDPEAWLSEVPLPVNPGADGTAAGGLKRMARRRSAESDLISADDVLPPVGVTLTAGRGANLEGTAALDLRNALNLVVVNGKRGVNQSRISKTRMATDPGALRYDRLRAAAREPFGPVHMPSQCGVKVRGARIKGTFSAQAKTAVGAADDAIRVDLPKNRRGANVLVELTDGSLVVAPAFAGVITGLSFDADGSLEDVWCEPSANTPAWAEYESLADETRRLRAMIAAASAVGVFRIENAEEGQLLLDRLREVRHIDPALAVYAAYAFNDRRMRSHIVRVQQHLDKHLGVRIFDVAMLAFSLGPNARDDGPAEMYPCLPMLTQGWPLMSPLGVTLPRGLAALRSELRPSVWTHFRPEAAGVLRSVLTEGKVD